MKPSRQVTVVATVLFLISMAGSLLLLRRVDNVRTGAMPEEVLYLSSPKAIKRLSLGYNGLMADIYWTRAIQYFGWKHHMGAAHYELLGPLLEITTTLDPKLLVAYEYGSNFLSPKPPMGAGMPQVAIDLIQSGIHDNPNEWRLYCNLGFVYYLEMKDYRAAAKAFEDGSKLPNAHPSLKVMAAQMVTHAGDLQMAHMLWTTAYESTTDKDIRANAATHLRSIQVDIDVTNLEELVVRYRAKTGYLPAGFWSLTAVGMLRGIPVDPLGHPYKLMPDGRIEVSTPDDFPFITKGTPPGYKPPAKLKFLPGD